MSIEFIDASALALQNEMMTSPLPMLAILNEPPSPSLNSPMSSDGGGGGTDLMFDFDDGDIALLGGRIEGSGEGSTPTADDLSELPILLDEVFDPLIEPVDNHDVLVVGRRWTTPTYWDPDPFSDPGGGGTPGGGGMGNSPGDYEYCQDTSTMTPEQREDYEVAAQAAEIAREIQAKSDRDGIEYGAIIYRDASGVVTHTPLSRGGPTSVSTWNLAGLPGWGSALGIVHSHPAHLYDSNFPSFRLHPTPYQDWAAFNGIQDLIAQDLMNNSRYSFEAAWAYANQFVQFV